MKRLAILGRGTVGAISAAYSLYRLHSYSSSHEIQWIYDPEIETQAVGEGLTLPMMDFLKFCIKFTHNDMKSIDANFKTGILKNGWGNGDEFIHHFHLPHTAYHINAKKMQSFIFDKIRQNPLVKIIESNAISDNIDADHVIDCSGKPKNFDDNFNIVDEIPVNSVYVTQCYWDYPRFTHSLTNAAKHGWYFGIPLQNRCSIGYLYNNKITTLEEIKEDVKEVFSKYDLYPSDITNAFSFNNYYRKETFSKKVTYNGNSSFFLEPIEATSLSTALFIVTRSISNFLQETNKTNLQLNSEIETYIQRTIDMISLHYFSGSKYNSEFWKYAKSKGEKRIKESLYKNDRFRELIDDVLFSNRSFLIKEDTELGYGPWARYSWDENIRGLGISEQLKQLMKLTIPID